MRNNRRKDRGLGEGRYRFAGVIAAWGRVAGAATRRRELISGSEGPKFFDGNVLMMRKQDEGNFYALFVFGEFYAPALCRIIGEVGLDTFHRPTRLSEGGIDVLSYLFGMSCCKKTSDGSSLISALEQKMGASRVATEGVLSTINILPGSDGHIFNDGSYLAGLIRKHLVADLVVDTSPMGCRLDNEVLLLHAPLHPYHDMLFFHHPKYTGKINRACRLLGFNPYYYEWQLEEKEFPGIPNGTCMLKYDSKTQGKPIDVPRISQRLGIGLREIVRGDLRALHHPSMSKMSEPEKAEVARVVVDYLRQT